MILFSFIIGDFFKSALPIRCVGMGLHSIAIYCGNTHQDFNCGLCSLKSSCFCDYSELWQMPFACFKSSYPTLFRPRIRIILWHKGYNILCKAFLSRRLAYVLILLVVCTALFFNIFRQRVFKTVMIIVWHCLKFWFFPIPSVTSLIFCKIFSGSVRR